MRPIYRGSLIILVALAGLALIGWGDYVTGYEISFGPLYALPIAWVSWRLNLGWGLALSLLATGLWLYVDRASGDHYAHPWHAWERAGALETVLAFVATSFQVFKGVLSREKKLVREMEGALPVCTCCKRIQDGSGYWMELGVYLREHAGAEPKSKLCPDCARKHYVSGYHETA